ncbi:MAG: tetratricopeptide repeat protein [Verrucomicrobia bacterium]|nr:tetratricopeptide repeat protein [Verrucomicrobiota bacterium]
MKHRLLLTTLALCAGALLYTAECPAEPDPGPPVLLEPGQDVASAIEAIGPLAETDLNAALRLGWLLHIYNNDNEAAKARFEQVVAVDPGNVWAQLGLSSIAWLAGDDVALEAATTAVLQHHPEHPLAELALARLSRLWPNVPQAREGKRDMLFALLDADRGDPTGAITSPELLGQAIQFLWRDLEWNGLVSLRAPLLAASGAVRSWRFAGPFAPLDDLMFFAALPPDADPVLAESYTFYGREHPTRRADAAGMDIEPEWVNNGVFYAETFVRVDAPVRALLEVATGDSVRVDLNGGTIYVKDALNGFVPDSETVQIELPAGWSRLRLKYQAPDYVVVRLLDTTGRALQADIDPTPRPVAQATPAMARLAPTPCEAYLNALAEADPGNPLFENLIARLNRYRGNTEAAKAAALRSLAACDDWAAGQLEAAVILAGDRTQPERIARSRATVHYLRAINQAGACPLATYALALYDQQGQRHPEAIEKLEKCVEQAPRNYLWRRALFDIYSERAWDKEREAAFDALLEVNPDAPAVVQTALDYYGNRGLVDAARKAEIRLDKGTEYSTYTARYLWRMGRLDEAIAEYERLAAVQPETTGLRRTLVDLYKSVGRLDDAARLDEALLDDNPTDTRLMADLATIELGRGNVRAAVQLWQRMLEREPADIGTRKALELHGTKDPFNGLEIDIAPYLADETLRSRYAEYASVMVIDYSIEQVFANGSGRQYTHQLVLVNTKAGIEQWGEPRVAGELREMRVIKPDGSIIEPELVGGKGSVSLTGLAVGDFIEIKYIDSTPASDVGPVSFGGPNFYLCSQTEPMHLTRYVVMTPAGLDLNIEQANLDVAPTTWTRDGWLFRQWERHGVEPIRSEPNSVDAEEFLPRVRVGFGQSAGAEPAVYEDANTGMAMPTLEVRQKVQELVQPGMSHEDIVHTLHTWVNTNIDGGGSGPRISEPASQTLGDRDGNRLGLLKAMLEVAGVPSHIVMARPVTAFDSAVFPDRFVYGLLAVENESGELAWWLDMNNKFYPFGSIHPQVQGARAVVLRDVDGSNLAVSFDPEAPRPEIRVPLDPESLVMQSIEAHLTVDDTGGLEAALTITLSGLTGAAARAALEQADEDQLGRMIQVTLAQYFRGATLEDYTIEPRKEFNVPLVAKARFKAPRYARKRDRMLVFNQPLFALNMRKSYTRIPERRTPMALFGTPSSRTRITITLPEGATIANAPKPLALQTPFGTYSYSCTFDETEHRVSIERDHILPIQRVQPADYAAFAAFCRAIDQNEEDELKVTLPEPPAEPEVTEESETPADGTAIEGPGEIGPTDDSGPADSGNEAPPKNATEETPATVN